MNLELFIAKRLVTGKEHKISISAPIIKIAIAAIAIGVVMMLIAIATGVGLKNKIREKVAAFNGHIQISNFDNNNSEVSLIPVSINQDFYPEFKDVEGVRHVQAVATKGGIIRTADTFEGMLAKGVGTDYDWSTFKEYLGQIARLWRQAKRRGIDFQFNGQSVATKGGRYLFLLFSSGW